jgi:gluconokinase
MPSADTTSTPVLLVVMGTSGSGKSTVGQQLAHSLDFPFLDADDFHPAENVAKMSAGVPLADEVCDLSLPSSLCLSQRISPFLPPA